MSIRRSGGINAEICILVAFGVVSVLAHPSLAQNGISDAAADSVRPVFVNATTDRSGVHVIVTFSEPIAVAALVQAVAATFELDVSEFYKAVFELTVDGYKNIPFSASLSDSLLTLRKRGSSIGSGQEVTVSHNNVFARDSVGLLIDAAGNALANFSAQSVQNVSQASTNVPVAGLTLTPDEMTIAEGDSATYTVALSTEPSGSVTVRTHEYLGVVTITPTTLTFTPQNWNEAQTVTLTGETDDNTYNAWTVVGHSATGGGYDIGIDDWFERVVVREPD